MYAFFFSEQKILKKWGVGTLKTLHLKFQVHKPKHFNGGFLTK